MALKKGFCTYCHGDERLRIFNVNKDAKICYCQNCMAEMQPKEAINNYNNLISHYLKKASKALFDSTQYLVAYQTFAHIIDLDDSIKVAHFGRILSLVYLSSLRKSKINFAFMIHRQEAPKLFHYQETTNEYFRFLQLLIDALDTYEARLRKRITTHNVFYDLDCVILYLKRIDEIRSYKDFISLEANYFVENGKEQFKEIIKKVAEAEKGYEQIYKVPYSTTDGYSYIFSHFNNNGLPLLSIKDNKRSNYDPRRKRMELNPKDGKKSAIKDEIYLNNLTLSRLVTVSIPLAIVLFVLALGGIITSFFIESSVVKIIILIVAASVVSLSLVLFILHFAWKGRLNKKYYNGTNPFIFK